MSREDTASYYWWAKLVVAVIAIPSFGGIVATAFPASDFTQIIIFILACWACTYLGMKLMQSAEKKD